MPESERTGYCGAENSAEDDCTEARCRDFGAFLSSQSRHVTSSRRLYVRTGARLSQFIDDKSFAGGFLGKEIKLVPAN